jgi:hypothetical protein
MTAVPPPVCISLGPDCATAEYLRLAGVRDAAYPFDWVLSPSTAGVVAALRERGAGLARLAPHTTARGEHALRCDAYGAMLLLHEVLPQQDDLMTRSSAAAREYLDAPSTREAVASKYERRWERLGAALAHAPHVAVFRPALRRADAPALAAALAELRAALGGRGAVTLHTTHALQPRDAYDAMGDAAAGVAYSAEGLDLALESWRDGGPREVTHAGIRVVAHDAPWSTDTICAARRGV